MLEIRKKDKASISNVLNEMVYKEKMTLQELRFFLVYLSKINPKNPSVTEITFSLEEYAELLDVELNEQAVENTIDKLLRYIVNIRPRELGEDELEAKIKCQLFSRCKMFKKRSDGRYYLSFQCHEDVKEHVFEFKNGRFTELEIWNVLNLHSFQDARLYMLLKQYLKIGVRIIEIGELKKMLGIEAGAYEKYKDFSQKVLKKAQKSLKNSTDICFEYKSIGRPAHSIEFTIIRNKDYTPPAFLTKLKNVPELPADEGKEKVEEEAELTISERRDLDRIQEFRDLMKENNPEWEESDARIIEMCDLINEHLLTIDQHMNLSEYSRDVSRYDFIHAVLKRANSEGARNLYKFFISQWERYKYGDEKGNGQVWIWD